MSSRALRKLQQETQDHLDVDDTQPSDDDISFARTGARSKTNPFSLLNAGSCTESEEVKDDDDTGADAPVSTSLDANAKKKKKRKNKKRISAAILPKSSEDNLEDEVDRSVREVNRLLGVAAVAPVGSCPDAAVDQPPGKRLLSVEAKNLNPENEMKKIFGSRVVASEFRQERHHKRGGGGRSRAHVRAGHMLVVPKPSWPHPGKTGLSMKFIKSSDNTRCQYFAFEHSQEYQAVQRRFFGAVDSLNPESIVQLLNDHPFHIDAMLQLSEICKMGEDSQRAAQLVERTIYAMETAFHPLFNLSVGTSRLEYRRQENRSFFIALFKHLTYVGSRACHRTALEFCKLILSLDPDADPLAMLLLVDFYALRAQQYGWLVEFVQDWDPKRNLDQLPNMAYSSALAQFYLGKSADTSKADEMLQKALLNFPGILLPLLDKCSVDIDMRVAGSKFFLEAQGTDSNDSLQLLSTLYVCRAYHVWKEPSILPWLEKNVHAALNRVESGDPFVAECSEKRKKRYPSPPLNICRHVILSDIKDAVSVLPRAITDQPMMSFDPLPPRDSIDTYDHTRVDSRVSVDDPSYVRMFFRTLLPNYNPADAAANDGNPDGAAGVNEGRAGLEGTFASLIDAMQDLLGALNLPENPQDSPESEDADDENWQ